MSPRFPSPFAAGKASAAPTGPDDWGSWLSKEPVGSACCCPARPAVRVIMPPCPARPHMTELLLCGHHYRVSRAALAAAKAVVRELPGTPEDVAAWVGIEPGDVPSRVG
jgi:hypothetical protein